MWVSKRNAECRRELRPLEARILGHSESSLLFSGTDISMKMSDSTGRAIYGKACVNCSKAKCKCVLRGEGPCERWGLPCMWNISATDHLARCQRLNKPCHAASSRRARTRRGADSNRRLEEKLDDLVALLRRPAPSSGFSERPESSTDGQSKVFETPEETGTSTTSPDHHAGCLGTSGLPACNVAVDSAPGNAHSAGEADLVLKVFLDRHLKHLPIIHIPLNAKADDLRRKRPFFWQNVEFVTETSFERQQIIGRRIRATLAQKLIVEHDRSVDLLMGLMTYLTW